MKSASHLAASSGAASDCTKIYYTMKTKEPFFFIQKNGSHHTDQRQNICFPIRLIWGRLQIHLEVARAGLK